MQNITSVADLKNAIQQLEIEQATQAFLLREQFSLTYEGLKPVSLFKRALKDLASTPGITDNILGTVVGLASGYVSKKIFVGTSVNLVRNLLGSFLKQGVTNVVAQHPDVIKSISQFIFKSIFRRKEHLSHEQQE